MLVSTRVVRKAQLMFNTTLSSIVCCHMENILYRLVIHIVFFYHFTSNSSLKVFCFVRLQASGVTRRFYGLVTVPLV